MLPKVSIACCFVFTAIVLHTCLRIEVLNARHGYFLPRAVPQTGNPKWRAAGTKTLLNALERTIAIERANTFADEQTGEPEPLVEEFMGPPYTVEEQALIETEITRNTLNSELRDWVSGMGLLQYILAPATLLLSLMLFLRAGSQVRRFAFVACAVANVAAMCLMVYRGYLSSLGW